MDRDGPGANPLRDPRDRRLPRVPDPCTLVVFGVTGDLATKKLIPAVYDLAGRGLLPLGFALVGVGRREWSDRDFERFVRQVVGEHARTAFSEDAWSRLAPCLRFVNSSFDDGAGFDDLVKALDELRTIHGTQGNAAFYLAIPPSAYQVVLRQLHRSGLCHAGPGSSGLGDLGLHDFEAGGPGQGDSEMGSGGTDTARRRGWRRVVVEKPFGTDLASARELNDLVDDVFTKQDVFRIDHYLGKETVQNLLALRFANTLFEPVWNSHYVDSVQITVAEAGGIESRGEFYDATGAARDVLQNHLLQLLALCAMEEPVSFDAEALRLEKRKVLNAISLPADHEHYAIRGQYEQGWLAGRRVPGYRDEADVAEGSTTETYAAVRLAVETRRWAGVPFYLRTGKRLPRQVTEIAVVFKRAPHLPFAATDTVELGQNQLVVRVQPEEGVTLRFGSKVPGPAFEVREVSMDFLYGEAFTEASPEAYERLVLDVLLGDKTLFPDSDEVEASWRVIDPLEAFWADRPPFSYRAGEWGPLAAHSMVERDGRVWRRP